MPQFQISRRLTLESTEALNLWQERHLHFENPSIMLVNATPTIALVSKKLVSEYFLTRAKQDVSIQDSLRHPISMEPIGLSVRPPRGPRSMVNMIFDEPVDFIKQRELLLTENGAGAKVGHYEPNLHVGSIRYDSDFLAIISAAVNNRPTLLEFMPAEIERV